MLPPSIIEGSWPHALRRNRRLIPTIQASSRIRSHVTVIPSSRSGSHRTYSSSRVGRGSGSEMALMLRVTSNASYPRHIYLLSSPAIRSCSSWRRGRFEDRPGGKDIGKDEQGRNERDARRNGMPLQDEKQHPYQPTLRERLWQQRMEEIRRMIDEDPYETLFGRSNRLRFGRLDWPFEISRWWQREIEFFKEPLFRRGSGKKVEIKSEDSVEHATEAPKDTKAVKNNITATSPSNIKPTPTPVEEDTLEYDPISNRMVRKADKAFSHYGQELDAAVDIPIKPYQPAVQEASPSLDRSIGTPSFTMLKDDPSSSQQSMFEMKAQSPENPQVTSARIEYNQFKARRLPDSEFPHGSWLVQEGFLNKPTGEAPASKSQELRNIVDSKLEKRAKLEENFEQTHSTDKEMAEERLFDTKPWKMQKSKGTSIPNMRGEESVAGKDILEYNVDVANTNRRAVRHEEEQNARKEILDYNHRVVEGNRKTIKQDHENTAREDVLNYNIEVAQENWETAKKQKLQDLKTEVQNIISEMDVIWRNLERLKQIGEAQSAITKVSEKADTAGQALIKKSKQLAALQTSLARHSSSPSSFSALRTSLQRYNKTTDEIGIGKDLNSEPQSRTHDPLGYNHSRESKTVEQYSNKPSVATVAPAPVPAELTHSNENEVGLKPEEEVQVRLLKKGKEVETDAVDVPQEFYGLPSNYNELSRAEQIAVEEARNRHEEHHEPISVPSSTEPQNSSRVLASHILRRVPSLAEVHGYTKPREEKAAAAEDMKRLEAESSILEAEINAQKAAMQAHEERRSSSGAIASGDIVKPYLPAMDNSQNMDTMMVQKDQDTALVREIRDIYETEYGKITTNHTQEPSSPPETPTDSPHTSAIPLLSPTAKEALEESQDQEISRLAEKPQSQSPAPSSTTPPTTTAEAPSASPVVESTTAPPPAPATSTAPATYTILAHDPQTHSLTKAIFTSVPPTSESPLPITLALKSLHSPAKFLPEIPALRNDGFVPVHAEKNLLIFRRAADGAVEQDLRLRSEVQFKVEDTSPSPAISSAKTKTKTSASTNNAPEIPLPPPSPSPAASPASSPRRLEPVFSGQARQRAQRRRRKRVWRSVVKNFGIGIGVVAATIYIAGVMAEMRRVVLPGSVGGDGGEGDVEDGDL